MLAENHKKVSPVLAVQSYIARLDLYDPIQSYMLAMLGVVAQACNPGTRGAEAGGLL